MAFGLVTGNLEPIGWGKMSALGILPDFSQPLFGGFGSDFCSGNTAETWKDRAELVRIANKRAAERHASGMPMAQCHCRLMTECTASEHDFRNDVLAGTRWTVPYLPHTSLP